MKNSVYPLYVLPSKENSKICQTEFSSTITYFTYLLKVKRIV